MRATQLQRRALYLVFGAAPATRLLVDLGFFYEITLDYFHEAGGWAPQEWGALLGTAALWGATVSTFPSALAVRWALTIGILAGLLTMAPWSMFFALSSVIGLAENHTDLTAREFLNGLWFWLCFIGPVAVGIHYLARGHRNSVEELRIARI